MSRCTHNDHLATDLTRALDVLRELVESLNADALLGPRGSDRERLWLAHDAASALLAEVKT